MKVVTLTVVLLFLGMPLSAQAPTMPFVDRGACPFEGCQYGDLVANRSAEVFEHPGVLFPSVGRMLFGIKAGEIVTAMTGMVFVSEPGRANIHHRIETKTYSPYFPKEPPKTVVLPEDATVYLLEPLGEGIYKTWFSGTLVDLDISKLAQPDVPGAGYSACVETQTCDGEIITFPKVVWWVQIRNSKGQIGWTDRTEAGIFSIRRVAR